MCIVSGVPIPFDYIRQEALAGRMKSKLMAIVVDTASGRTYRNPTKYQEEIALGLSSQGILTTSFPEKALGFRVQNYGMADHQDLFTPRQLVTLQNLTNSIVDVLNEVYEDALRSGLSESQIPLRDGGIGAYAYSQAVVTRLMDKRKRSRLMYNQDYGKETVSTDGQRKTGI